MGSGWAARVSLGRGNRRDFVRGAGGDGNMSDPVGSGSRTERENTEATENGGWAFGGQVKTRPQGISQGSIRMTPAKPPRNNGYIA